MISFVSTIAFLILMTAFNKLGLNITSFLVVLLIIALLLTINLDCKKEPLKQFRTPITLAYILRIALMYFDVYCRDIYILPNSGADSEAFYREACNFAANREEQTGHFSKLMGSVFSLTGDNRILGQLLVVLFSIVAIILFAFILNELSVRDVEKRRIMYIVCLIPNFAILSSIYLRESIVCMFVTASVYMFVLWISRNNEAYFLLSFIFVFVGAYYHSGVVGIAVGLVVIRIIYDKEKKHIDLSIMSILCGVVAFLAFVFIYINYGDEFFSKMGNAETITDIANTSTSGGSSYAAYVGDSSSVGSMVIYTIPRIVYFLFSPFPWQWRGISDLIAFFFSGLFYLLTILHIVKFFRSNKHSSIKIKVILLSIVAFSVVFVFAWGVSNVGTAVRHRDKLIILFATLYAMTDLGREKIVIKWGNKRVI